MGVDLVALDGEQAGAGVGRGDFHLDFLARQIFRLGELRGQLRVFLQRAASGCPRPPPSSARRPRDRRDRRKAARRNRPAAPCSAARRGPCRESRAPPRSPEFPSAPIRRRNCRSASARGPRRSAAPTSLSLRCSTLIGLSCESTARNCTDALAAEMDVAEIAVRLHADQPRARRDEHFRARRDAAPAFLLKALGEKREPVGRRLQVRPCSRSNVASPESSVVWSGKSCSCDLRGAVGIQVGIGEGVVGIALEAELRRIRA